MSRSSQWRRTVSEACNWHQTQALEATIYLLRQTGPTGFLLKEEGETKTVKVYLGDPHTCTCAVYKKERDLCKHICWLLLRKFRLSQNDPLSWQLGLVEREVNEILQGRNTAQTRRQANSARQNNQTADDKPEDTVNGRAVVQQREISDDDVCPICQDELLTKKLAVTYCRFGCGNTIHMKCMQVWAEHQQKTSQDKTIKCPMCREDFGTLESLKTESRNAGVQKSFSHGVRLDRHLGIACSHCSKAPIEGKCYKCVVCPHFYLCQRCFNLPVHTDHSFQFRQKRNQRWRAATRALGASLPPALVQDLQGRDLSENDYDSLLLLDRNAGGDLSTLTEENLQRLPLERVRERGALLSPGAQCRVCLRGFLVGQFVRRLPCQHKFHKDCIDNWLIHSHPTCPIDGMVALTIDQQQQLSPVTSAPSQTSQGVTDTQTSAGLAINAMGIPVASSRLHQTADGSNPTLRRPPRIPLQPLPTTPHGLEVAGLAVVGGETTDDDHDRRTTERLNSMRREETVPGERLLRQARLHRQRISQHLNNVTNRDGSSDRNQRTVTLGDLIQCQSGLSIGDHGDVMPLDVENGMPVPGRNSRHNSAGSIISVVSDTTALSNDVSRRHGRRQVRSHGASSLRERPSSLERSIPSIQAATQNVRDLFLGNDPSSHPPVNGDSAFHPATGARLTRQRRAKPNRLFQSAAGHAGHGKHTGSLPRHTAGNDQQRAEFSLHGFAVVDN